MKVLVTGSDGYIGSGVITELISRGHEVVACGLAPCGLSSPLLTERIDDVFSLSESEVKSISPDAALHLAWRDGFRHNALSHIDDLPRHWSLVRTLAAAGVPRIAGMGTMHEVGYHEGVVTADTPCRPMTPYAVAKNALRELMREACNDSGAQFLWLRGFYLVSADGRGESVFSKMVQASREGAVSFPFTSGSIYYDFLDYREFCRLTAAAVVDVDLTGIVNVCSGVPETLKSRAERFIADNKLGLELEFGAFPDRPYDSPAIWGDAAAIRSCAERMREAQRD